MSENKKSNITLNNTLGGVGGGGNSNSTTERGKSNSKVTAVLGMDIVAKLQPFGYVEDGKTLVDYDVLLTNNSYIGRYKLGRYDAKYSWVIRRAIDDSEFIGKTNKVMPCKRMDVSEIKKRVIGGASEDFVYLNTVRDKKSGNYWISEFDEYCVTLVIEMNGEVVTRTERVRITGNKYNGWILTTLNI